MTRSCRIALVLLAALTATCAAQAKSRDLTIIRKQVLGRSALGRAIRVVEIGDPDEARKVLVIGCIHGDEPQGIRIAQGLAATTPPRNADMWIIPTLNPDGVAAQTRQNAHGVDLNRNFPWRWERLGSRGSRYYSGPRPLSEPESQLASRLILRLHPALSIWFHQPYGLVDESGGDVSVERRFANLVGLPLVRLPRFPGSVASWENTIIPGSTAFVVELHAGALSVAALRRFVRATRIVASA